MKNDFIISGYTGSNYILRVHHLPRLGMTEIVQNKDNSTPYYGGNGLNVAVYLARLGMQAMPIIRGGFNYERLGYPEFLRSSGVSDGGVSLVPDDATSVCYLAEDDHNDHMTFFYPGAMDGRHAPDEYPDEFFANSRWAIMTVASQKDNRAFLKGVKKHNLPMAFAMRPDPDAFPPDFLNEVLHASTLVFMNEMEQDYIRNTLGYDPVERLPRNGKAETVIVTHGPAGCVLYSLEGDTVKECPVPATRPDAVIDTTGAGDSFLAGYLYGVMLGLDSVHCAAYGATESSFIIEAPGCLTRVPDAAQMLDRCARRRGSDQDPSRSP